MHFKVDTNLEQIVRAMHEPKDIELVSYELYARFQDTGLIDDLYGETASKALSHVDVSLVCDVLGSYLGIPNIPSDVFQAFRLLIVMGEGHCEKCGGKLSLIEHEYEMVQPKDRDLCPYCDYERCVYRCEECGDTIITNETI